MKRKIIGILIVTLLIATALPSVGMMSEAKDQYQEQCDVPVYLSTSEVDIDFVADDLFLSTSYNDFYKNDVVLNPENGQTVYISSSWHVIPVQTFSEWLWHNFEIEIWIDGALYATDKGFDDPVYDPELMIWWIFWSEEWYATPGSHTITVIFDPDNNIAETDEGNNEMTIQFSVVKTELQCKIRMEPGFYRNKLPFTVENTGDTSVHNLEITVSLNAFFIRQGRVSVLPIPIPMPAGDIVTVYTNNIMGWGIASITVEVVEDGFVETRTGNMLLMRQNMISATPIIIP